MAKIVSATPESQHGYNGFNVRVDSDGAAYRAYAAGNPSASSANVRVHVYDQHLNGNNEREHLGSFTNHEPKLILPVRTGTFNYFVCAEEGEKLNNYGASDSPSRDYVDMKFAIGDRWITMRFEVKLD